MTNAYDSQTGLLQQKVDAKNNKVTYSYDTYKRVIGINRYEWVIPFGGGAGSWVERVEQKTVLVVLVLSWYMMAMLRRGSIL